jgi:hypothetical protein
MMNARAIRVERCCKNLLIVLGYLQYNLIDPDPGLSQRIEVKIELDTTAHGYTHRCPSFHISDEG